MLRSFQNCCRRFRRDERGNIFVLFGASSVPLLLIMGGAVDLVRYTRYKAELSAAVDSASLALSRKHRDYTVDQAEDFVTKYVASMMVHSGTVPTIAPFTVEGKFTVNEFIVEKTDNGFTVDADASMDTIFLPLGNLAQAGSGIMEMPLDIDAEVVHQTNRLEVALVLDNTGSMNCVSTVTETCANDWATPDAGSRIVALKAAATTLVNYLMKDDMDDPDQIKIALVPFETAVNVSAAVSGNIGVATNWPSWIDKGTGETGTLAKWNGRNFDGWNFSTKANCTTPGTGSCKRVGHRWLYDQLYAADNTVKWAGCVEMRAGTTYELTDTAPDTAIPDSLYVPYFAPDEPDNSSTGSSSPIDTRNNNKTASSGGSTYSYLNDYLQDKISPSYSKPSPAQKHLTKYYNKTTSPTSKATYHSGRKDVADTGTANTPYEYGPNRGCPKPIVPLTNADGRATINTAIDKMIAYWHAGTFIPTGLIWGWHVLSSGEPFTQGIDDDDEEFENTVKAIVLLTDGDNQLTPGDATLNNHNNSNYTSYSLVNTVIGTERRLSTTASASEGTLDTKFGTLCTSVKTTGGIRLYTISFGTLTDATKTMISNCATLDNGERLYYHAPSPSDLADIFGKIGEDLSNIHLSM
jgi:Flp pilus assembly protein TadG